MALKAVIKEKSEFLSFQEFITNSHLLLHMKEQIILVNSEISTYLLFCIQIQEVQQNI
jgi:hypothetical protein